MKEFALSKLRQDKAEFALLSLAHDLLFAFYSINTARYKDPWPENWLNVENLILFDQSILVYKILNKLCPASFWNMFQLRSSLSNCNTRNYKDIHIPMLKLESTKKGFQYASIKAWNNISLSTRELPSLILSKSHLKKHLMSNEN